jgi:phospholipase/lecithinase/hemolysin
MDHGSNACSRRKSGCDPASGLSGFEASCRLSGWNTRAALGIEQLRRSTQPNTLVPASSDAVLTAILWTAAFALVLMTSPAHAIPAFDRLVVFGDSLSDNGNAGRSSNGPVWVEHLAVQLGLTLRPSRAGGSNYAVGGARLSPPSAPTSLRIQADTYLKGRHRPAQTLYIVYGGGNDILDALGQPQADAVVEAAVQSLQSIVADLAARGAVDILVPNLPDVGMIPAVRSQGGRAVEEAGRLARQFNRALNQALASLGGTLGLRLHRLDVEQLASQVQQDPGAFGFRDITHPCSGRSSCQGHLFWDDVHPTTEAHQRLASAAFQVLSAHR